MKRKKNIKVVIIYILAESLIKNKAMKSEDQKILDYWIAVESKYRNRKRDYCEESHYKHALDTIKELSPEYAKSIQDDKGRIRRIN